MRLLDLFCGAGGAAMGYHRAGFDEIVGVDHHPQPRYPFKFVLADALEYCAEHGAEFDMIHASPPCQAYSRATAWRGRRSDHPDLIDVVRKFLVASGLPYVIENVEDARSRLRSPVMLCGTAFGLAFRRHRYFELSWQPALLVFPCNHSQFDMAFDHGKKQSERAYADAIGCGWMTVLESREAIPPVYTEWVGRLLVRMLELNVGEGDRTKPKRFGLCPKTFWIPTPGYGSGDSGREIVISLPSTAWIKISVWLALIIWPA